MPRLCRSRKITTTEGGTRDGEVDEDVDPKMNIGRPKRLCAAPGFGRDVTPTCNTKLHSVSVSCYPLAGEARLRARGYLPLDYFKYFFVTT